MSAKRRQWTLVTWQRFICEVYLCHGGNPEQLCRTAGISVET